MNRLRYAWPVLMTLVIVCYAVWFVGTELTLYHADQVTYWSYSLNLAHSLVTRPLAAVFAIARSVAEMDLNLLPAVPIAAALAVFGGSRLAYVVSVISVYGLAAMASSMFALCSVGRGLDLGKRELAPWAAWGAVLTLSTIWRPIFIGYLGIGGVALGCLVLGLYLGESPSQRSTKTLLIVGFLAALLMIFRRWYGFWSLAFGVMVVVDATWSFVADRDLSRGALRRALRTPLIVAAAGLGTLLVLSPVITFQRLTTDYSDRFSAYSADLSLFQRLASVVHEYGLGLIALVLGAWLVIVREPATRRIAVLLAVQLIVAYAAMVSVQDHSPQHWYLYAPAALLLLGLGLLCLESTLQGMKAAVHVGLVLLLIAVTSAAAIYVPAASWLVKPLGPIVPGNRLEPEVRDDLAEIDRMMRFLDQRLETEPGYTYVLASSDTLSEHVLAFTELSLGTSYRATRTILQSSHVDKRDGFPVGLLDATTVLVAEPVQLHLDPADQQVIAIPAESFLDGRNIARAFRRLEQDFTLQGGVRVVVFARTRPNRPDEVRELSDLLAAAYPDRPEIFRP